MVGALRDACFVVCSQSTDSVVLQRVNTTGSADDKTTVWSPARTEYVFMAGGMFVINARDSAIPKYYTFDAGLDNLSDIILFRLSEKILDGLK